MTAWATGVSDHIFSLLNNSFMSILVSFLVVTRTTITYNRFMLARSHLANLFRSAREIVQYTCLLSLADKGEAARKWRQDVAYRTIVTLRMVAAAVEYRTQGINSWEALPDEDHQVTELMVPAVEDPALEDDSARLYSPRGEQKDVLASMAHGPRSLMDENCRAPVVWTYNLREEVMATRQRDVLVNRPFHPNEELRILHYTSEFQQYFHGLKTLITTPFPFPLVQMERTFLFFWVFSLPLLLISKNDQVLEVLILTFFCTYGFFGLEESSNEMSDPFGSDPNDFPIQRWVEMTFEDIYIYILKTDGDESAVQLRSRITDRIAQSEAVDLFREEKSQQKFWMSISKRGDWFKES